MNKDILYLGSQSGSRQKLLREAQIGFKILAHASDERVEYPLHNFREYVLAIAQSKMDTLVFPNKEDVKIDYLFVLTADTLVRTVNSNQILGKPRDRDHAKQMLAYMRQEPVEVITGCCLEKFYYQQGAWVRQEYEHWTMGATAEFIVEESFVDQYLNTNPMVLSCAGAATIEDYGALFLKSINGSYSAVIGLPLFQLRQALQKLQFKF